MPTVRSARYAIAFTWTFLLAASVYPQQLHSPVLPRQTLAQSAFGNDAPWFLANIPFLDIDDAAIERTYYYRWQVYRSHLREIGPQGTTVTEFLQDVPWARQPWEDLNDSASFHILEGRWLRDPAYVTSLVDHLYTGGGNDRHFSESIAAATFGWTQVTGDPAPALRHLDTMEHVFNLWDDHFNAERGLYWIEPLLDATEYTVGSIDASGAGFTDHPQPGNDGFFGGFAYRPSINAYQFGNARAIASLASMAGQPDVAAAFTRRAETLRQATLAQLWNPKLGYFSDVYQRSTPTVSEGAFVRNRELVGMVPWQFELPPATTGAGQPAYNSAWQFAFSSSSLAGKFGLRTTEPSYPRYLTQYRYDWKTGQPECQWNGPSWPFQTSQALSGLANLLNDYAPAGVTADDYAHLLRQYTEQHRLASGVLDVQEDYNPDTGQPIVGLPRSHHYNHSTYIDLVLSGLLGIRPRSDDVLELNPLLPSAHGPEKPIRYFALEGLRYHGHDIDLVYDADGKQYGLGAGLFAWCDGRLLLHRPTLGKTTAPLPKAVPVPTRPVPIDLAVNVWSRAPSRFEPDLPIASASSTAASAGLYEPLDGRLWFFPEIAHGWSPAPVSTPGDDWYAVDLRHASTIGRVELAFFADGRATSAPASVRLQVRSGAGWTDVTPSHPVTVVANGITPIDIPPTRTQDIRVLLQRSASALPPRLVSFRVFGS